MAIQSQSRISASTYYQLPEYQQEDGIELIQGEVILELPPNPSHQEIVGEILYWLMTIARRIRGHAFTSPIEVYFDEYNIFEPDALFLLPDSSCQIEEKRLVGAPDLVVEVLSPSTAKYDRQEKYQIYEQHGVGEYWIVDPIYQVVEVWVLKDDAFVRQGAYGIEDTVLCSTLNESILVADIFVHQSP